MRALQINRPDYKKALTRMLFEWNNTNIHPLALFLAEMVKISDNSKVNLKELKVVVKQNLGLTDVCFRQTIFLLKNRGDIVGKLGPILFLHPKYQAINECEGVFVITIKDE